MTTWVIVATVAGAVNTLVIVLVTGFGVELGALVLDLVEEAALVVVLTTLLVDEAALDELLVLETACEELLVLDAACEVDEAALEVDLEEEAAFVEVDLTEDDPPPPMVIVTVFGGLPLCDVEDELGAGPGMVT